MAATARARRCRRVGLAMVVLALAAGLNLMVTGGADAQDDPDPALVEQGQDLFVANCAICHGPEGLGSGGDSVQGQDPNYGPPIANVGGAAVDFMVRTGRMPAQPGDTKLVQREPQFGDTERAALVAYVESLAPPDQRGPGIPEISGWQDADLGRGLELFTTNCAACHGPTAAGIAVGRDDVSSNLKDTTPIEIAEAVRVGPGVMPVFGDEVVTDEDLEAIVAWVQDVTHRDSPGGVTVGRGGPVSEGMIAWVVGAAFLGVVIYLLGEREGTLEVDDPRADDNGGASPDQATGGPHA